MAGVRSHPGRLSDSLIMPALDERTEASAQSSEPESPRPRRRMSQVGERPVGRRGSHAPEMETSALLRERFLQHMVTQVKLSNVVRAPRGVGVASPWHRHHWR